MALHVDKFVLIVFLIIFIIVNLTDSDEKELLID